MWQDILMSAVCIIFILVSIPQVLDCYYKRCKMNAITCSATAIGLVVMAFCMFTLGAYFTMLVELVTAAMWGMCWQFSGWKNEDC